MNIEYVPFSFLCNLKYTEMFCAIIEPRIRTQDSYDKSLVVSDHDQIQYQICNIPLTPLQHPPSPPSLPLPAQTLHAGQARQVRQLGTTSLSQLGANKLHVFQVQVVLRTVGAGQAVT